MRTKTINIYKFSELPEDSKRKALEKFKQGYDYAWTGEWQDTRREFERRFPVKVRDYSIGAFNHSYARTEYTADEDIFGHAIVEYMNNCHKALLASPDTMTGYCGDYDILQPILDFMKNPEDEKSLSELLKECVDSWVDGYQKDMEFQLSDEYQIDHIESNEYEFTEDGELA